ncbi:immunoglobulin-like domain-containing protein [Cohnella caldifontis]|uniref:immunoglobulin-like domain-containing protein n=1 Tax=Cohnella caldifontis TaxID=3027471 RepID=UPI0023EAC5BD|nr:immunoglobulin-like domain-containing protein [Cohnella sp. YIM B05605]
MKKRIAGLALALSIIMVLQLAVWPAKLSAAPNFFLPAQNFTASYNTMGVFAADFNHDGKLDLAAANYSDSANGVTVMTGNGDGTFNDTVGFAAGGTVSSIAGADFNGDDNLDLVVANQYANTVSILYGNGDAAFSVTAAVYGTGSSPQAAAVGDFNGDGAPDIATCNYVGNSVSVLLGHGDGTFQENVDYAVTGPMAIAVRDFNGDGLDDVAVTNTLTDSVAVLFANGNKDGTLLEGGNYPTGSLPKSVVAADLNGDAHPDLVVLNGIDKTVSVFLANADGTFQTKKDYPAGGPYPTAVAAFDGNGDGYPDLAVGSESASAITMLMGNGDGTFRPGAAVPTAQAPYGFAPADFNGDGKIDVAVAGYLDHEVSVVINGNVDAYAVAADVSMLSIGYAEGDDADSVTQPVLLPTAGANGSTIDWASDHPEIIGSDGKVTRPDAASDDTAVQLTATVAKGSESDSKTFALTVLKDESTPTDEADVTADRDALTIGYADGDSASAVTRRLLLPAAGGNGTSIAWASSRPDVIDDSGIVFRPAYDAANADVTLTAVIIKGEVSQSKTFAVTVLKKENETLYRGTDIPLFNPDGEEDTDGGTSAEVDAGMPFHFFGQEIEDLKVYVQANGNLAFLNPESGRPDNVIAPFGDDLNHVRVMTKTIGSAPGRKFVVQWTAVDTYPADRLGTIQAILYEGTDEIQFKYRSLDRDNPHSDGSYALIGLVNGSNMLPYSQYEASVYGGLAVRFTPDGEDGYAIDNRAVYDPVFLSDSVSSNADLSALTLSDIRLDFAENVYSYSADVPYSVAETAVTYSAARENAEVQLLLNGEPVVDPGEPLPLAVGANEIKLVVTAEDHETQQTYTVNVTRASEPPTPSEPPESPQPSTPPPTNPPSDDTDPPSGQTAPPSTSTGTVEQNQVPDSGSFDVTSSERTEWSLGDDVKIIVPAGAVPSGGKMTVTVVPVAQAPESGALKPLSRTFDFSSTTGRTFNTPVEITFHYDTGRAAAGERPTVYYYNEVFKRWLYVGGVVNADGTVTIRINHFTKFAVFGSQSAGNFADLQNHWSAPYAERLIGMDVLSGYPDRTFRPETPVTRAQIAVMLTKALMLTPSASGARFADDAAVPAWAKSAVSAVTEAGFMHGDGSGGSVRVRANDTVTRAEMAVLMANVLHAYKVGSGMASAASFQDNEFIPAWARASVDAAAAANVLTGFEDGSFRPGSAVTRAEAAAMIYKLLDALHI